MSAPGTRRERLGRHERPQARPGDGPAGMSALGTRRERLGRRERPQARPGDGPAGMNALGTTQGRRPPRARDLATRRCSGDLSGGGGFFRLVGAARARVRAPAGDERGDYAIFIAVIASALLLFGSIAYDAPRLIAARQNALHEANEAARVAAATIAAGGTVQQARDAAQDRLDMGLAIYGQPVLLTDLDCVGTLVQVSVITSYAFRGAVLSAGIGRQAIEARGAAEAFLVLPGNQQSQLNHLAECPLDPAAGP